MSLSTINGPSSVNTSLTMANFEDRLPLRAYTSHLPLWELRQILRPSCWKPLYLSVLNISVTTSLNSNSIIPSHLEPSILPEQDNECYVRLTLALSNQLSIPSTNLSTPDVVLREILCFCSRLEWGSREGVQLLVLLDLITDYLFRYVKPWYSNIVEFNEPHKSLGLGPASLGLKHRCTIALFDPPAIIQRKFPRIQDSTLPMLTIVTPYRRPRIDFSYEAAYLLSLAQRYFIEFPKKESYQPYLLTIRAYTSVLIVTAKVERAYIDSVDKFNISRQQGKGLKVMVSEEFNLVFIENRRRFLEVYMNLLTGLALREGIMEELTRSLKRKRENIYSNDKDEDDSGTGCQWIQSEGSWGGAEMGKGASVPDGDGIGMEDEQSQGIPSKAVKIQKASRGAYRRGVSKRFTVGFAQI